MAGAAVDIGVKIVAYGVTLAIESNKANIDALVANQEEQTDAEVELPDGTVIKGYHRGQRRRKQIREFTCDLSMFRPRYTAEASGMGEFHSKDLSYTGRFFEGKFHDPSREAVYIWKRKTKYVGCFENGYREGPGTSYLFSPNLGGDGFYKRFEGEWRHHEESEGRYFDEAGNEIEGHKEDAEANPENIESLVQIERRASQNVDTKREAAFAARVEESEVLQRRLQNPASKISVHESIELLSLCLRFGEQRAKLAREKNVIFVIGNTGAGKSTFVNYLCGCTMKEVKAKSLGLQRSGYVVVVKPPSEGGAHKEVMQIGNHEHLKTFLPEMAPFFDQETLLCDCPAFLDNRGAEITIANALNVRAAMSAAKTLRIVILIDFGSFRLARGEELAKLLQTFEKLFGSNEAIAEHSQSLLVGLTGVPRRNSDLEDLREEFSSHFSGLAQRTLTLLSERLFIFDALEEGLPDSLNRKACTERVLRLTPLENSENLLKTVLLDGDQLKLEEIMEGAGDAIQKAIDEKDFQHAADLFSNLKEMQVANHIGVSNLIEEARSRISRNLQEKSLIAKSEVFLKNFKVAESLTDELEEATRAFQGHLGENQELPDLRSFFNEALKQEEEDRLWREEQEQKVQDVQSKVEEERSKRESDSQKFQLQLESIQSEFTALLEQQEQKFRDRQQAIEEEKQEECAKLERQLESARERRESDIASQLEGKQGALQLQFEEKLRNLEEKKEREIRHLESEKETLVQKMEEKQRSLQEALEALETKPGSETPAGFCRFLF